MSAILTQAHPESGQKRTIAYASRALTDTESRYGQIEREALAIYFACLKFQVYLLGKPFTVVTDHKPLIYMFNKPRAQMPFRIERIRRKLQGFEFTVVHKPGKTNPSDYISRKPMKSTKNDKTFKDLERHVNFIIKEGCFDAVKIDEIRTATSSDKELNTLRTCITSGKIDEKRNPELGCYAKIFNELSVSNGIVLKGQKIVIPRCLRKRALLLLK